MSLGLRRCPPRSPRRGSRPVPRRPGPPPAAAAPRRSRPLSLGTSHRSFLTRPSKQRPLVDEAPRLLFQGVMTPVHEGVAPSGVLDIVRGREETIPELGGRDDPPRNSTPQCISFQGKSVIGAF